jgi:putative copper resistance protein D
MLPPFNWTQATTNWQFAPVVTVFTVGVAVVYLWGVLRVQRRHPRRPWPLRATVPFLLGLLVINVATQSGIGTYDDTLFWDHMVQHLMLLMVAPPLLVAGQPVTLLLHASRNPVHTVVKRVIRSRPVHWLTWPAFGVAAYAATVVGTHLTSFYNLVVEHDAIHQAEHVLYLVVGYLYFLPLLGREPIKWKISYPLRLFLLFIAMPVDAFTGVVLGSYQSYPFAAPAPRSWGPSPVNDLHQGGAVMWIGGAAIMFVVIMVTFFQWTRETRSSAAMGWLESARRASLAERIAEAASAGTASGVPATAGAASAETGSGATVGHTAGTARFVDVDEDEDQLAAYNDYLARINGGAAPPAKDDERSA